MKNFVFSLTVIFFATTPSFGQSIKELDSLFNDRNRMIKDQFSNIKSIVSNNYGQDIADNLTTFVVTENGLAKYIKGDKYACSLVSVTYDRIPAYPMECINLVTGNSLDRKD